MSDVEITPHQRGRRDGYVLRFEFDRFLVELLKKIPKDDRAFYGVDKNWWIASEHLPLINAVLALTGYVTSQSAMMNAGSGPARGAEEAL